MNKRLSLILSIMIFSFICYGEDFYLSIGDELKITILSDFEGLEFNTSVNKNGNIFLYKLKQNSGSNVFDGNFSKTTEQQAEIVAFEKVNVAGKTMEELKQSILLSYKNVLVVKDVEIELLNIKERVYIDFGDQISYRRFEINKTYKLLLSEFPSGINISNDSILVRNASVVENKSLDDYVKLGDYIFIYKDVVFVTGEVKSPKVLSYNPNLKVREYIAMCGGITHYGSFIGIKVKGSNGKYKNVSSQILPGDEIYIPANYLAYIRDFNTVLSIIATALTALVVNGIINF